MDNVTVSEITDNLTAGLQPDVVEYHDYDPFGMLINQRTKSESGGYRYGFNGMEKDNELKGEGNSYNYGMRFYDSRIGRFFAYDPIAAQFPYWSPYHFAGNSSIENIDLDGLETYNYRLEFDKAGKSKVKLISKEEGDWFSALTSQQVHYKGGTYLLKVEWNYAPYSGFEIVDKLNGLTEKQVDDFFSKKKTVNQTEQERKEKKEKDEQEFFENYYIASGIKKGTYTNTKKNSGPTRIVSTKTAGTSQARQLLNKALKRQNLNSPPNSFKEKWSEDGFDYEVRIHEAQSNAPAGSNSASTTTFRVARRKQGTDASGQGSGWEYADDKGNWYKNSDLKANKTPNGANDTHIPLNQ